MKQALQLSRYNCSAFTKKAIKFIKHELKSAGMKKIVIGLSGGIDSAVVASLCVRSVGKNNVLGLIMPYKTNRRKDIKDAQKLARVLGIKSRVIKITPQIDSYFKKFPQANRIRRGNKMARERMSILFDHAHMIKALVAGTGNKSECLMGYCTLYGDAGCSFNPLAGLYKTQVIVLARHLKMLDEIIDKTPSAGLWPGQSDEKELGISYQSLDKLLYNLIDLKKTNAQLIKMGFPRTTINRIINKIESTEFKRKMPNTLK